MTTNMYLRTVHSVSFGQNLNTFLAIRDIKRTVFHETISRNATLKLGREAWSSG